MEPVFLTTEMMVVLGLLAFAVVLFVSEIIRIDLAAILVMVLLGGLASLPGLGGLADPRHLFDGFASNAVISIIAVMIIGAGLDKTGLMSRVAAVILKYGGTSERRVVPIVSTTAGVMSSFLQNVGAAALFLPVVSRISARTGHPLNRLLMPMGVCAILGGTLTMVGSSPLILLNDLIVAANPTLPPGQTIAQFSLFSVTPIGTALVLTGVLYFALFGRWVLPAAKNKAGAVTSQSTADYLKRIYHLKADPFEVVVPAGSPLVGSTLADLNTAHHIYIVGTFFRGQLSMAQVVTAKIDAPCRLAIIGRRRVVQRFAADNGLTVLPRLQVFAEEFAATNAGVAELVIPPNSNLIGRSPREIVMRSTYGLSLLAIHRGGETFSQVETEDHPASEPGFVKLRAGDTLVAHIRWDRLTRLKQDRDFVVVTTDFPQDELRPKKVRWAVLFFLLAIALILFTDLRLSLCLLTGALGMILVRVLTIDEAYRAVGWNTVFLVASLIPVGQAVQTTGTATWIAQQVLTILDGWPLWSLQAGVAVLATVFTALISNVGAVVLVVPLAISIAVAAGGDPALFAVTAAISTSNSFLIPTHQVNALIMGPAGYRVVDFVRAGGVMTVLFWVVSLTALNLVF